MTITKLVVISISLVFALSGCAAYTQLHRDSDSKIWKVESRGNVHTIIKQNSEEVDHDGKGQPIELFTVEVNPTKLK